MYLHSFIFNEKTIPIFQWKISHLLGNTNKNMPHDKLSINSRIMTSVNLLIMHDKLRCDDIARMKSSVHKFYP